MNLEANVCALFIYPIKSCAGMPVDMIEIDESGGARGDREWAVVNEHLEVTWQGAFARLALISPGGAGSKIVLSAAGFGSIATAPLSAMKPVVVKIWNEKTSRNDEFAAFDAGDELAAWLTFVVGAPLRLVRLSREALLRDSVNRLHVVTAESVSSANDALVEHGQAAVDVIRYRPNIVLQGIGEPLLPFIEDHVTGLRLGPVGGEGRIDVAARCIRCVVPNVDPRTAATSNEPLNLLTELSAQRHPGGPTTFGIYGRAVNVAKIECHMTVALDLDF